MSKQPTNDQKLIARVAVGTAGALAGQKLGGLPGLLFGAIALPLLHAVLDEPFAVFVADLS